MGRLNWYKRDPKAALTGMMVLNLEERGAYNTVLDLIYDNDDHLPDDDHFISGWLGCDVRVWKRIKASLIAKEKLTTSDGLLQNFRATSEVDVALRMLDQKAHSGRSGGRKSAASRKKNNGLAEAPPQAPAQAEPEHVLNTPTPTTTTTIEEGMGNARATWDTKSEWDFLRDVMAEAAGWQQARAQGKLEVVGPIVQLLKSGADLDLDVLPVIRRDAPKCNSPNWKFFVNPIAQARDGRKRAGTTEGGSHERNRPRSERKGLLEVALGALVNRGSEPPE